MKRSESDLRCPNGMSGNEIQQSADGKCKHTKTKKDIKAIDIKQMLIETKIKIFHYLLHL